MASRLDAGLVGKAVSALLKYDEKRKNDTEGSRLIADFAKPVNAQIQLLADIATPVLKPVRVRIPHTIFNPTGNEEHNVCIFCRSEDSDALKTFLAANEGVVPGLDASADGAVLSINDVKKYYKEFKQLKNLSQRFTHFLCDARIMSQLYNLLGKSFGKGNNYPVPIDFKQVEKFPASAIKALQASSYIHLKGKCINLRLGNADMAKEKLVANALQGLEFAATEKLPKGWAGVHSISLKLADSASLPIYARDASDAGVAFIKARSSKGSQGSQGAAEGNSATKGSKRPREEEAAAPAVASKAAKKTVDAKPAPKAKQSKQSPAPAPAPAPAAKVAAPKTAKAATPAKEEKAPLSVFKAATPKGTVLKKLVSPTATATVATPKDGKKAAKAPPATAGKTPSKADVKFKSKLTPEGAQVRKSSRGK